LLDPILIEVRDASAIGEARRAGASLAERIGLTDEVIGRLALVITELGTNLIKHASGGTFLLGRSEGHSRTIEALALDAGPGIPNLAEALRDGHSTTGTPGTGLGTVARQADFFQVYSRPKQGTAAFARIASVREALASSAVGAVSIPFPGERVNGDGWLARSVDGRRRLLVVDGLGHGEPAHAASVAACKAFGSASGSPSDTLVTIHEALRGTRGAAAAVAELDPESRTVRFAGIGNISATIVDAGARRSAVSLYGIVGHQVREAREYTYPWTAESTLIMHSDGLTTRWDLDRYPGLLGRDPILVAGVLWRDHHRRTDDSTVVVARAT
jgi:anti-sigma regulatory factor (Ser/Thr protein kinase)